MHKIFNPRLITALIAVAFSGSAAAAGFQLLEQNASGLGNAYAGSAAVAENAGTIYFNPAGMTELRDLEISGGLTAVNTSYKFTNEGSSVGFLGNSGNRGDGGGWGFLPNAYISKALNKNWYVGLGIGAQFGLKTEFSDDRASDAEDCRGRVWCPHPALGPVLREQRKHRVGVVRVVPLPNTVTPPGRCPSPASSTTQPSTR